MWGSESVFPNLIWDPGVVSNRVETPAQGRGCGHDFGLITSAKLTCALPGFSGFCWLSCGCQPERWRIS